MAIAVKSVSDGFFNNLFNMTHILHSNLEQHIILNLFTFVFASSEGQKYLILVPDFGYDTKQCTVLYIYIGNKIEFSF